MRPAATAIGFCVWAMVVVGCERGPIPSTTSTEASTSSAPALAASTAPTAAGTTTPAPPPAPPRVSAATLLRSAVAVEPAARVPLAPGAEAVVDPASTFEIELSARVPDALLQLVDGRGDLVEASATRELAAGTRLTLSPAAPLVPASRYALRIDGVVDRELHDEAGRAYAPVTLPLLAAGAPPPPEPKKPDRKRRRR